MRDSVTTFKSLNLCLKELKPFICDGQHLETGKPFKRFGGLRSREILANWLLCVVAGFEQNHEEFKICTDPQGGDGIIYNQTKKQAWPTEHILVSQRNKLEQAESLILKQIEKKQNKGGAAYASGKTLIVFLNKQSGEWYPNKLGRSLPHVDFESVWVVGLQNVIDGQYNYNVTRLDPNGCPIWRIHINKNFESWKIEKIQ
ncbi:TPA: hypothetical protein P5R21_001676 [Legionella pneumophila]|nr:hypothetical protein [Legionella pneumophila]HCC3234169.1 hypothetical protein [Legionella pneumophila subsp. pneumophila]HDO7799157.1 hypothetical protein [Legionella pneumophila]HDO7969299.1 hypothetical protein [Legionella pneumophila]HDO7982915.1 hypothetical protein [Legionella pneumophila]